jgi:large subunit ribosomal protein L3
VIEIEINRVTQVKTVKTDGYHAVQVTTGSRRASRISKAIAGHYAKADIETGRGLWEFRNPDGGEFAIGNQFSIEHFRAGQKVDITGQSKGKGFQGGVKRWNFHMQDATHGNSVSHRALGSTGQCQTPGRVWKGKKMAGHMGASTITIQSLEVVRVDVDRNLLLIKGAVPGSTGGDLIVKPAVKTRH